MARFSSAVQVTSPRCPRGRTAARPWTPPSDKSLRREGGGPRCPGVLSDIHDQHLPRLSVARLAMSVNEDCITSSEWFWKEASAADAPTDAELSEQREPGWCPGGAPPSEVHVLLLEAGLIPHPYVGFNEHAVQCEWDWRPWPVQEAYVRLAMQGSASEIGYSGKSFVIARTRRNRLRHWYSKVSIPYAMFTW